MLDLAAGAASLDEALGWIFRACGSRKTTPDRIAAAMALRGRVRWRTELSAALGLGAQGVHSRGSSGYVTPVCGAAARAALCDPAVPGDPGLASISTRTCLYQAYGVVVELDGLVAHPVDLSLARSSAGTTPAPLTASIRSGTGGPT